MKTLLSLCLLLLSSLAAAELPAVVEQRFKELESEFIVGPASVEVANEATLKLPAGFVFIPMATLRKIFEGTPTKFPDTMQGLITSDETGGKTVENPWGAAALSYTPMGHVDDADVSKLNPDKLLATMRKNVADNNENLKKSGQEELEVTGWHEAPKHDAATHQMQWSLVRHKIGRPDSDLVSFDTLSLGREGILEFMVVVPHDKLAEHGHIAAQLLAGISFKPGRRYEDFDPEHDKKAKSTLASLIDKTNGLQLGLIALLLGLLAKFGKVIAVVIVGAAAGLRALGNKKKAA